MAAAREEGLIRFAAVSPDGGSVPILGYKDTRQLAPSGKIAEPEQWYVFPLSTNAFNGTNGWKIQIIMKAEASDTLDNANDTIAKIPAIVNGIPSTLGKDEFQMETGDLYASPSVTANTDVVIGEYDIPAGTIVQLGGAKGWLEPYDDTA
jgi:hypothetical protein